MEHDAREYFQTSPTEEQFKNDVRSQRAINRERALNLIRMQRLFARDRSYLKVRKHILETLGVPEDLPYPEAEKLVKAFERRYKANNEGEILTMAELFEPTEEDVESIGSEMDFFDQLELLRKGAP